MGLLLIGIVIGMSAMHLINVWAYPILRKSGGVLLGIYPRWGEVVLYRMLEEIDSIDCDTSIWIPNNDRQGQRKALDKIKKLIKSTHND